MGRSRPSGPFREYSTGGVEMLGEAWAAETGDARVSLLSRCASGDEVDDEHDGSKRDVPGDGGDVDPGGGEAPTPPLEPAGSDLEELSTVSPLPLARKTRRERADADADTPRGASMDRAVTAYL